MIGELEELLDDTELISATLDTLSNLKFKITNTSQIVGKLFTKFTVIDENDMPSTVKFILKAANSLNSTQIFVNLRDKLNLEEITHETNRFMIFEIVREFFYISNQLTDLFLGIMSRACVKKPADGEEEDNEDENGEVDKSVILKPIDFLIFSILYTLPANFKVI